MSWIRAWLNSDLYHFYWPAVNLPPVPDRGKAGLDNGIAGCRLVIADLQVLTGGRTLGTPLFAIGMGAEMLCYRGRGPCGPDIWTFLWTTLL